MIGAISSDYGSMECAACATTTGIGRARHPRRPHDASGSQPRHSAVIDEPAYQRPAGHTARSPPDSRRPNGSTHTRGATSSVTGPWSTRRAGPDPRRDHRRRRPRSRHRALRLPADHGIRTHPPTYSHLSDTSTQEFGFNSNRPTDPNSKRTYSPATWTWPLSSPAPERLHHTTIGTQQIYVVLPEGHHLAAAGELQLDALEGETFIANPPSYNLRQLTETWCREAGYDPDIAIEVTEFATIRELISRNLGIALLPPHDDRTPTGITEIPLAGPHYTRTIALAWGTTILSAPTRRLNDYLLSHREPTAATNIMTRNS